MPLLTALGLCIGFAHIVALIWIGSSIASFISSPQIRAPLVVESLHSSILNGELAVPMIRMPTEDLMVLQYVTLTTGQIRFSEPTPVLNSRGMVSDQGTLWAVDANNLVYETDGKDGQFFPTKHRLSIRPAQNKGLFLYEGHPAIIDRGDDQIQRLLVLIDQDWVEKGQLALPGADRTWTVDQQTGQSVMQSRFSEGFPDDSQRWPPIQVLVDQGQYHLFQFDLLPDRPQDEPQYRLLYRQGFDFTTTGDANAPASALAPANALAEATGWQSLPVTISIHHWFFSDLIIHDGDLFFVENQQPKSSQKVVRRWSFSQSEPPATIQEFDSTLRSDVRLIADPVTNTLYAMEQPRLGECSIYRWNGTRFEKLPFVAEGLSTRLLRQLKDFFIQIVAVLWIGTWLSICGANWLMNRTGENVYAFGTDTVTLSSILRRSIARTIDLALMLVPLGVTVLLSIARQNSEQIFSKPILQEPLIRGDELTVPILGVILWALIVWAAVLLQTAIWGTSPGKWLCRIRTVRTTFRPCGFARSLVRELLLWFDAPLLLTGVPAVMWFVGTHNQQRLGDLIADTIVIDSSKPLPLCP